MIATILSYLIWATIKIVTTLIYASPSSSTFTFPSMIFIMYSSVIKIRGKPKSPSYKKLTIQQDFTTYNCYFDGI